MQHIATVDKEEGTVIMIQIENEIGMLEDARDYSREANKIFNAPVPAEFMTYLQKNKKALHPQMLKKWESQGCKKQGYWQEVFGADIYTDESSWHGTMPNMWKDWHKQPVPSITSHYMSMRQ